MISSPAPGSGKTVFTAGLLRVCSRRGLKVQPYKCGPDSMDAQLLALAGNRDCINLDTWLASRTHTQQIYNEYGEYADVCITEGKGGLFDGHDGIKGSSAELAALMQIPVILIVNARTMGYSAAGVLHGFKNLYDKIRIAGVVFNHVSAPAHLNCLKKACEDVGLECLGALPTIPDIHFPTKHSSLTTSAKQAFEQQADIVADYIEQHIPIQKILHICQRIFPCNISLPYSSEADPTLFMPRNRQLHIAIAKDPAFPFVNRINLERLKELGKIHYFSPVYGSNLPQCDLLYLPDGYPELFARQLHRRKKLLDEIRNYAINDGKILAEGGGLVLLGESILLKRETQYEFTGLLPLHFKAEEQRLTQGYRLFQWHQQSIRGHEFRYLTLLNTENLQSNEFTSCTAQNSYGAETSSLFLRYKNIIACTARLYWGESNLMDWWKDL